ncbi:MAG: DUF1116 domain-containing protein [Rhodospirillaceae bacterium]
MSPTAADRATKSSAERITTVQPALDRIAPLRALPPALPERCLYHAGPPFAADQRPPKPVLNSMAMAAVFEGWAADPETALDAFDAGDISLAPAQDIGVVTPLAFVVGPSTPCLSVKDLNGSGLSQIAPVNDGPLPDALRFGTGQPQGLALLKTLADPVTPDLAAALRPDQPLLPLLAKALAGGDDLHGCVAAAQDQVLGLFTETLSDAARNYIAAAGQFVLNIIMASSALMLRAGAGVPDSRLVIAAGGNGIGFGIKLSSAPEQWIQSPANRPVGPLAEGIAATDILPAIGDSAVIDALGFGAACLRFSPSLLDAVGGAVDPGFAGPEAHGGYLCPHPDLTLPGLKLGLDSGASGYPRGVMLAMLDAAGERGLLGRGIAGW